MEYFYAQLTQYDNVPPALLFAGIVWATLNCFGGYVLFRLLLVITAVAVAIAGGSALLNYVRPNPSGADYLIALSACTIALGLAAWLLYRLVFAMVVAAGAGLLVVTLGGGASTVTVTIGALVGLAAATVVFLFLREVIIILSSLAGGLEAAILTGILLVGGVAAFRSAEPWVLPATLAGGGVLAVVGAIVQFRTVKSLRRQREPEEKGTGKPPAEPAA